jgi:hypothetical protein
MLSDTAEFFGGSCHLQLLLAERYSEYHSGSEYIRGARVPGVGFQGEREGNLYGMN